MLSALCGYINSKGQWVDESIGKRGNAGKWDWVVHGFVESWNRWIGYLINQTILILLASCLLPLILHQQPSSWGCYRFVLENCFCLRRNRKLNRPLKRNNFRFSHCNLESFLTPLDPLKGSLLSGRRLLLLRFNHRLSGWLKRLLSVFAAIVRIRSDPYAWMVSLR